MEDVFVRFDDGILKPAKVVPGGGGASRDLKSAVAQLRQKPLKCQALDQQRLSGVCVAQISLISITHGMALSDVIFR